MIFGKTHEEFMAWQAFYAWRPVHLPDGKWAWLERVERRPITWPFGMPPIPGPFWEYRLPQEAANG